jgi:sulfotransferase family protein
LPGVAEHFEALRALARRQLFFVGGAPRSGTTWLQTLLDSHPDIVCGGEGLFLKHLADPLGNMMAERHKALAAKNDILFRHTGGFPLPAPEETELLVGTAVLLALERLCNGRSCRAVGEKTPENVFFFPRLKRLFPSAKFIGIARDPRDVLTSAWHFFHKTEAGEDEGEAKRAFIRLALPSLHGGTQAMLALREAHPADCLLLTYEGMRQAPAPIAAQLFRFLGVSNGDDIVTDCVARTSFAAMSGRSSGVAQERPFFRKGVVGDWRSTFTPEMNGMILHALGWSFAAFGWEP